ncbi:MAG: TIGR03619 family F420-dependent LLM class oxidoreductase [Actinomycetia bacterium]|nr:TIGR03619 family F420-dependent LLM class oxidoreductase [Actinomycetes bacterium]
MAVETPLKVRIGFGLGTRSRAADDGALGELVDALEDGGWDSLWFSEQLGGPAPDPLVAMAWLAGRTRRLKFGTAVGVVPGRNPVVLAKQMATLDRLSDGRFLPALGLGAVRPIEQAAFGVQRAERAPWFDEALGLMRRLWTEDDVTHDGERFSVSALTVGPKPVQEPLEVWLGGRAPSELRRVGRLGDGWLPSFCTPSDVARGWELVTQTAAEHERRIDPQHLGALVPYSHGPLDDAYRAAIEKFRPDVDVDEVIPAGAGALRDLLQSFIAVGASKFVLVPVAEPTVGAWSDEIAALSGAVMDLQT